MAPCPAARPTEERLPFHTPPATLHRPEDRGHVQPEGAEPDFELPEDLNLDGGEAGDEGEQAEEEQVGRVGQWKQPLAACAGWLGGGWMLNCSGLLDRNGALAACTLPCVLERPFFTRRCLPQRS